uniref:Uncharacterized protein n=1 Tax=Ixodes ricinus TaxID=34613 RepID=A0A6B0TWN7_IXORI
MHPFFRVGSVAASGGWVHGGTGAWAGRAPTQHQRSAWPLVSIAGLDDDRARRETSSCRSQCSPKRNAEVAQGGGKGPGETR